MSLSRGVAAVTQRSSFCRQQVSVTRYLSTVQVAQAVEGEKVEKAKKERRVRHTKKNLPTVSNPLNVHLAINKMRELAWAKFDETVEIAVNLGVDPRKPNQSVKVSHYLCGLLDNQVIFLVALRKQSLSGKSYGRWLSFKSNSLSH
jgi:hypothetical protein